MIPKLHNPPQPYACPSLGLAILATEPLAWLQVRKCQAERCRRRQLKGARGSFDELPLIYPHPLNRKKSSHY